MTKYVSENMNRFNYLTSEIDAAYHDAALKFGLSDSAMMILYAVCCNGDSCLISDIIYLSGTSKQTVNSALRKLEADNVVYLEAVNGRKKRVCLTDKGRALAEHTVVRLIEIENSIFASWSEQEQEMYLALIQRYLNSFREKIKEV